MDPTQALALPASRPQSEDDFYNEHGQGIALLWTRLTLRTWTVPRLSLKMSSPQATRRAYTQA